MAKKTTTKTESPDRVLHAEDDVFEFVTDAGTIRLPYLENVPMGIYEDHIGRPANEFLSAVMAEYMDDDAVKARRSMTIQAFNKMSEQWIETSGIELGELMS